MTRSARAMSAGVALSFVLHAILAYVLHSLAEVRARREAERAPAECGIEVRLERAGDGALVRVSGEPVPVTPGGSEAIHNVDARARGDRGARWWFTLRTLDVSRYRLRNCRGRPPRR